MKMAKYYAGLAVITLVVIFFVMRCKSSQYASKPVPPTPVAWQDIETAAKQAAQDGKPLLIDFYTDWCGWCKRMDQSTYRDTALIRVLNTHFHPVKFNAEKGTYTLNGKSYGMQGQFNKFAVESMQGNMAFPTTVILRPDLGGMFKQEGYMDGQTLRAVATYFYQKQYDKRIKLNDFVRDFK